MNLSVRELNRDVLEGPLLVARIHTEHHLLTRAEAGQKVVVGGGALVGFSNFGGFVGDQAVVFGSNVGLEACRSSLDRDDSFGRSVGRRCVEVDLFTCLRRNDGIQGSRVGCITKQVIGLVEGNDGFRVSSSCLEDGGIVDTDGLVERVLEDEDRPLERFDRVSQGLGFEVVPELFLDPERSSQRFRLTL